MSGLIDQILSAGGGSAVNEIASRFGLSEEQSKSAIEALTPMIAGGFKNQVSGGNIGDILGGLLNNGQDLASSSSVTNAGNEILGSIFGSKDVSRQVAANAAQSTGISVDALKQMLPVIATMAAGAISTKTASGTGEGGIGDVLGSLMGGNAGGASGIFGNIVNMLDKDKNGNPLDDIMKMLGK